MAVTKVVMPKLSEAMETGKLLRWLKQEGDRISGGDIIAEIETDKADIELEAFGAGVLRKIVVPAGERASVGGLIAVIAEPADDIGSVLAVAPGAGGPRRPRRRQHPPSPRHRCRSLLRLRLRPRARLPNRRLGARSLWLGAHPSPSRGLWARSGVTG